MCGRLLAQIPAWMTDLPKGLRGRHDKWRRWAPGIPGSQERVGADYRAPRLWEIPKRRINTPEIPPPWREEVARNPGPDPTFGSPL